ncbi:hypothetical protein CDAR_304441 [Caerostris darwini]|uniref:Uncharacterized protein n=1 Tax=Caerostris darwini TaxID=1538125 RepID=A0AAV4NKN9_9ARAC|nr:hypothetical protein CDAR_304441 [Caerostris darwini]
MSSATCLFPTPFLSTGANNPFEHPLFYHPPPTVTLEDFRKLQRLQLVRWSLERPWSQWPMQIQVKTVRLGRLEFRLTIVAHNPHGIDFRFLRSISVRSLFFEEDVFKGEEVLCACVCVCIDELVVHTPVPH